MLSINNLILHILIDDHFQAFNVTLTTSFVCISLENLQCVYPTHHFNTSSGLTVNIYYFKIIKIKLPT